MIERLLNIGLCCILLSVAATLSGCTDKEDIAPQSDSLIAFTIEVEQNVGTTSTRADGDTWGSSYASEASAYDCDIDTETLQVVVLNADGSVASNVVKLSCNLMSGSTNRYRYYGVMVGDKLADGDVYRCMVVANAEEADIEDSSSECSAPESGGSYIPMWGVASFTAGDSETLTVSMLRAVAKCRIALSDEMKSSGYTLESASVSGHKSRGYLFPGNYTTLDNTRSLAIADSYNPLSVTAASSTMLFVDEPGDTGRKICYIAECENTEEESVQLQLNVKNGEGTLFEFPYSLYNSVPKVIRNHLYDFTVSMRYGTDLRIDVADWEENSVDWDFTEHLQSNEISWKEGTYNESTETSVSLLHGVPLVGDITISSPVGATWYASLTYVEGEKDAIQFVRMGDDGSYEYIGTMYEGTVGVTSTVSIMALDESITTQNKVKLTIVVRFLNGKSEKIENLSKWTILQPV